MKVAIVHDFLVRYWWAEKLVQTFSEMFPNAPIYTLFFDEKKMWNFFPKEKVKTSSLQKMYRLCFWRYTSLLPFMPRAIEEFDFSWYDLVISSSAAFSHWIITNPETKHICYVHSPMRWAWDYFFEFQKERWFWKVKKWFFRNQISKIREWDQISSWRPDKIIAASNLIKNRIKKYWRKDSEVIYPFVELNKFKVPLAIKNTDLKESIKVKNNISKKDKQILNPYSLALSPEQLLSLQPYHLVVSQLVPYKKIDEIIKAFNKLWEKLLIVWEWIERKKLEKLAKENIEFLWPKYWDELIELYQNAKSFIFAWIDDFGITPIEAMACWIPVIAINKWWAKETVINWKTWFFFEEQTWESIFNCLRNSDIWKIKPENCRKRAEEFSKEIFVEKMKEEVEKILK